MSGKSTEVVQRNQKRLRHILVFSVTPLLTGKGSMKAD